jgi:hypothetical protein
MIAMVLAFFLLRSKIKAAQPSQRLPTTSDALAETALEKLLRMDWIGAFIFVTGGILILLALNWGSTTAWNASRVIISFVIGISFMLVFILWQYLLERQISAGSSTYAADPMVPLTVFHSYDVCAVQYVSFVSGMVTLVMFYFVAIFMTIVNGLSPVRAGVQLVYFAPGMVSDWLYMSVCSYSTAFFCGLLS